MPLRVPSFRPLARFRFFGRVGHGLLKRGELFFVEVLDVDDEGEYRTIGVFKAVL